MDFCRFEIEEIENAALKDGEEEKVAADFKRFSNARRIAESLSQAYDAVSGDAVSRAFREIDGAMAFDEGLKGIRDELCDVDSLLSDLSREIAGYMDDMTFDEAAFQETQERLDLIRSLETKYGKTIPEVLQALEEKKARLQELENYDELREQAEKELEQAEAVLKEHSEALSAARKQFAGELVEKIADGLSAMDKSAEIQRDRKGNILYDKETKDTEIVRWEEDIKDYMAREVLPHIPDAQWFFEENLGAKKPVVKTGAEIPFTRYFYKYQQPVPSEELEAKFMELELSVSKRVTKLFE